MNETQIKQAICEVGHNLWQLGFVAANDGMSRQNRRPYFLHPRNSKRILTRMISR